jgi:cytochrome c peroxidase
MNKLKAISIAFFGALILWGGCVREADSGMTGIADWKKPDHFPEPHYDYANNPKSKEVFELGRRLFYDPIFSVDSSISCASCHHQEIAFADFGALSTGVYGRQTKRHSPALFNLAWHTSFMWDAGIIHIELMPIAPITDSLEMALPLDRLLVRLNRHPYYRSEFKRVMQRDSITDRAYLIALAQFMGALISDQSPYDQYIRGERSLTEAELRGKNIFDSFCASCHVPPMFTDYSTKVNGSARYSSDPGRYTVSMLEQDRGAYKVPSLRNVMLTSPYFHNGSQLTLDHVLDHYASVGNNLESVDPLLNGGIQLNTAERADLIQFLKTLTDSTFIQQTAFSNPWKQ